MAERPKAKKAVAKSRRAHRAGPKEDELIRALGHPLRRQILRLLHSSKQAVSPNQIAQTLKLGDQVKGKLSTVSYHVKVLSDYKTIRLVDQQPRRGAVEHFYRSEVSKIRWVLDRLRGTQECDEAQLWTRPHKRS